jgi:hypothetical protein
MKENIGQSQNPDLKNNSTEKKDKQAWKVLLEQLLQEHLFEINDLLDKNRTNPTFSRYEIMEGTELKMPWLVKTKLVNKFKNGLHFPLIDAVFGKKDNGQDQTGAYYPAFFEQEKVQKEGSVQICLLNSKDKIESKTINPDFYINPSLLKEINTHLNQRDRLLLPSSLSEKTNSNSVEITDYQIDDTNSHFYTLLILKSKDQEYPLTFHRVGNNGSNGEVYVIHFSDNTFGLIENKRPLIGVSILEVPRGYANKVDSKYRELWEETGLDAENSHLVSESILVADPEYSFIKPFLRVFSFDKSKKMRSVNNGQKIDEEDFEYITPKKVSLKNILDYIRNGEVYDSHSLSALFIHFLNSRVLLPNNQKNLDQSIVFENKSFFVYGQKQMILPRGPINQGKYFGDIVPDSGSSRIFYQINRINKKDLPLGEYQSLNIKEILKKSAAAYFDIVTTSAIFKYLLMEKYLIINPEYIIKDNE